ncbi:hypothetical protein [Pseudoclavibacter sp. VKM Ac-2888]|uniref:hypothetical protein n=1 Tax=Pseudoclavibacter sp. VKM Ac-2888 TaxID=2783830 RepID=UPI00188B101F|nr:hypothetical protein [Pseudoclavibacter sp. VKM Ac-2888]MBF4549382.1 hypothetical protein [Pseudoclavibacter sp. VKM Ac-2888]
MSAITDRSLREFAGTTAIGSSAAVTIEIDRTPKIVGGSAVIDVFGADPVRLELDDATELAHLLISLDEHVQVVRARLHEEEHRRQADAERAKQSPAEHGRPDLRLVPATGA